MTGSQAAVAGSTALPAPEWRQAAPALAATIGWLLFWYRDTWLAMVDIWARSGTFAHGFVVPPIALWLLWRQRARLASLSPSPSRWAVLALVPAGSAWLMGELAAVNAVSQLACTSLLVLSVVALLGPRVGRVAAFPLAFLFFAVPVGEFAMPQLMDWTADFVVAGLRLSGVPVYREGLQFVIPSGYWSVVEACSGIRYLIASATVGTLYAYLTYRSLRRRLLFVAVSLVVPVVANWLRAYLIVMIGHLSGNRLAVGVDHLIYGWLFFGLVVAVTFWIGSRWREDQYAPASTAPTPAAPAPATANGTHLLAASAVMAISALWPIAFASIDDGGGVAAPSLALPAATGSWHEAQGAISDWQPHFQDPSAQATGVFRQGDQAIGLYLGYYRGQGFDRKMISSTNVLVPTADPVWAQTDTATREIRFGGRDLSVRVSRLRRADGQRLLVWQCYWVGGRLTADDHLAKLHTAISRLRGEGDDSAVILLFAPEDSPAGAEVALADFASAAGRSIEETLARTGGRR